MLRTPSRRLTFGQIFVLMILTPALILAILSSYALLSYRAYKVRATKRIPAYMCDGKYSNLRRPTDQELTAILAAHQQFLHSILGGAAAHPDGERANLCDANLEATKLSHAVLSGAIMNGARLNEADLSGAILAGLNDTPGDSGLADMDLRNAWLLGAKLNDALLERADLRGARFGRGIFSQLKTDLTGAKLAKADLDGVVFDVQDDSITKIMGISEARNLAGMTFKESPSSLQVLRKVFKESGLRRQEREITYAIEHSQMSQKGPSEWIFNWLLFELPCAWGLYPGRAIKILVALGVVFSIPYMFALRATGKGGIWAVWADDSIAKIPEPQRVLRVTCEFPFGLPLKRADAFPRVMRAILIGLYFSLISASQIGWHDLNVGNWISRIQPREFNLRATGWVRVLGGIQSLLSVYLLALWVLTYFGSPFE